MLHVGELGVHPPGALGVGFFVHAGAESFIGRSGDGITQPLKDAGSLNLDDGGKLRLIPLQDRIFSNLLEADTLDRMPELLLVCCNPDQLGLFTAEMTRYLENLAERGRLSSAEDIGREVPITLILPNGILAEQMLQRYEEQLHESVLMRRLPELSNEMHQALRDRVVRGVSLQAGGRRGTGAETVYILERRGSAVFAGGGDRERERIETILTAHDYPFTHARDVPGTRVEFDKATISIVLNVGGLIHTVKPDGELIDLRMGDLCKDPAMYPGGLRRRPSGRGVPGGCQIRRHLGQASGHDSGARRARHQLAEDLPRGAGSRSSQRHAVLQRGMDTNAVAALRGQRRAEERGRVIRVAQAPGTGVDGQSDPLPGSGWFGHRGQTGDEQDETGRTTPLQH
jgi:hypothetical protein